MAGEMQIVVERKGGIVRLDALSREETEFLHQYWRLKPADRSFSLLKEVGKILRGVHDRKAWLRCDCDTGAMMYPALHGDDQLKLVRMGSRTAHGERNGERCSFEWAEGELGRGAIDGAGGLVVSKLPAKPDFLIFAADDPVAVKGEGSGGAGHTRQPRKDKLQQHLFWMLREARMHLHPKPFNSSAISQFSLVLESVSLVEGIQLSKVVWFTFRALSEGWVVSRFARLRDNKAWPKGTPLQGFLILAASAVDQEQRSFIDEHGNRLCIDGKFSVYGRQGRHAGPYLAIVAMCERDGEIVLSRAYLHPVVAINHWLPVDSGFEREAFAVIAKFLYGANKDSPGRYELIKPLEDFEIAEKGCRPDFVIEDSVMKRTLVIETMGASDQEYRDRKAESHELMKQLGPVFLDERINRLAGEADESLRKALWRWHYNRG